MSDTELTANDLVMNLMGTAYNVLLEQEHPDVDKLARFLSNHTPKSNQAFDLRYRNLRGEKL